MPPFTWEIRGLQSPHRSERKFVLAAYHVFTIPEEMLPRLEHGSLTFQLLLFCSRAETLLHPAQDTVLTLGRFQALEGPDSAACSIMPN